MSVRHRYFENVWTYFQSLPNMEVYAAPETAQLPYLKGIFEHLEQLPFFKSERFVIDSASRPPGDQALIQQDFQDAIVFYLGNEAHRLPPYSQTAKMIFTNYPPFGKTSAHIHELPLGWNGDLPAVPWRPWQARTLDLFFYGQLNCREDLRVAIDAFKRQLKAQNLSHRYCLEFSQGFLQGLDPMAYSQTMMNSRLALVPRGFSPITYRFFEAARYGTIIVTDNILLPQYLKDFPRLVINHWGELTHYVLHWLKHPTELELLHQQTLAAYQRHLSESAVANSLARIITGK